MPIVHNPIVRNHPQERKSLLRAAMPWVMGLAIAFAAAAPALATSPPDHRAYELVTRYEENGHEVGLSGAEASYGVPSADGNAVDWQSLGGCCGAASAVSNVYQSDRGADGWQTKVLTPVPPEPSADLLEEQVPTFMSPDLRETIFATSASYAAGDHRPFAGGFYDLYLEGPTESMTWLSQGPFGSGSGLYTAEFDGATPNADEVVFSTAEPLTENATGLTELNPPPQYLYVRDVAQGTTELVDVGEDGKLLSPYGASLGSGGSLDENLLPVNREGVTTNAISSEGSKVFFEAPPADNPDLLSQAAPHLYMRDLATHTTTPLDDSESSGSAEYQGAASDGSLVFFTSNEGLHGAPTTKELYEFNTTDAAIGPAPALAAIPISNGAFDGVSAISNDGTHVFFVAESALAANVNPQGRSAVPGQPNLYVYDTQSGSTTFIATLLSSDINTCDLTCGGGSPSGLLNEPDTERPAYPTPDGSVLVFASAANLTGQNDAPATTLTTEAQQGQLTIEVASTAGFAPHEVVAVGSGANEELDTIKTVDGPSELTVGNEGPELHHGLSSTHDAGEPVTQLTAEIYRYDGGSLVCISCTPPGVAPTASADLGAAGGGSYAPPGRAAPMSADGEQIFFDSADPLLPEAQQSAGVTNVYEWEDGSLSLISDGGGVLNGTTPSGDDVFFTSRAHLLATAGEDPVDIYDARVGGGFPESPPTVPCTGESCRAGGPSVFLPTPGSANLTVTEPHRTPRFVVASITARQRAALARTGRLTLRLSATAAGKLSVEARATLSGRSRRVAHASTILSGAGTVRLTLRLSAAARVRLATGSKLIIQIDVHYSANATSELTEFQLLERSGRGTPRYHKLAAKKRDMGHRNVGERGPHA
jgi:hypothetical protein